MRASNLERTTTGWRPRFKAEISIEYEISTRAVVAVRSKLPQDRRDRKNCRIFQAPAGSLRGRPSLAVSACLLRPLENTRCWAPSNVYSSVISDDTHCATFPLRRLDDISDVSAPCWHGSTLALAYR
jgi:hypothetical protein